MTRPLLGLLLLVLVGMGCAHVGADTPQPSPTLVFIDEADMMIDSSSSLIWHDEPRSLVFEIGDGRSVELHADGTVTLTNVETNAAARAFWHAVKRLAPEFCPCPRVAVEWTCPTP